MKGLYEPLLARSLAGFIAAGLLLGAMPASASDAAIRARVEARLKKAHLDQTADIGVDVRDGAVILSGAVLTVDARRSAEKAALEESKKVENRLRVLPQPRSDAEIRKAVADAVLGYPLYGVFDSVDVGVQDGTAILRGSVRYPYRKTEIDRRVARVPGVREVRNEIQVQSTSLFDDRLRHELARAIYGDDRFLRYAHRANPPIRIIVDRGRVTLTGWVATPLDRALLGHIARGTLSFGVDNKVGVDGEKGPEDAKPSTEG